MKMRCLLRRCSVAPLRPFAAAWACAVGLALSVSLARAAELPPPNTFLLSGKLQQANVPAAGAHDFRFQLYDRETGGQAVAGTLAVAVTQPVNAGDWQVVLDVRQFAAEAPDLGGLVRPPIGSRLPLDQAAHTANALSWRTLQENWLEIAVRRQGAGEFVPLTPRQRLTAVPGAVVAQTANHALVAGTVAEGGVDSRALAPGAITAEKLSVGAINNAALANLAVTTPKIAALTVVRSLNGLQDDVTLAAGTGVSLSAAGNTLTINSTATGGGTPLPNGNFLGVDNDNQFGGSASFGVIGGGQSTKISDENTHSTLGGGQFNRIYERSGWSFLGGGYNHQVGPDAAYASLGGGYSHILTNANSATIAGGSQNVAGGDLATVGGGGANFAGAGGTVAGGGGNRAEGAGATVGGGFGNLAKAAQATVGGGNNNVVEISPYGTVAGGGGNRLTNSIGAAIGGGEQNGIFDARDSVVGGGLNNVAGSPVSSILGGEGNRTEGVGGYVTVLGGSHNLASATHSLAAGFRAHATHNGSFVWNAWQSDVFASQRDGEFAVHAPGGVRLQTDGGGLFVDGQRVGTGGGGGTGPLSVVTAGDQTQPQLRLEQTIPGEYMRVFMRNPGSIFGLGVGGPNGWLSFYVPGQSLANTVDDGADRFIITPNGDVGVGNDVPFAQFHVRGRGDFSHPQIRATQLNAQDFARLRLETGPQAWDIAAGPDGSLRFFGGGADRLILGADGVQFSTGVASLTVNGRAVAFVDQLGQGGGQPGNGGAVSATVALGTAVTAVAQDLQAGVGLDAQARVGVRAISTVPQGTAVQAIQTSSAGYAGDFTGRVKVSSTLEANGGLRVGGALRVTGLGDNTPTAAFRLVPEQLAIFSAGNPGGQASLWAILDHPRLNANPDALLLLTPVNASAYKLYQRSSDVMRGDFLRYFTDSPDSPAPLRGRWIIDVTPTPPPFGQPQTGALAVFNAMIVTP